MSELFHRFMCLHCARIIMRPPCDQLYVHHNCVAFQPGAFDLTELGVPVDAAWAAYTVGGSAALTALVQEAVDRYNGVAR